MSCHATHSTHHVITLTGIGADSMMLKGVQTAYACARGLKSCLSCRETVLSALTEALDARMRVHNGKTADVTNFIRRYAHVNHV